MKSFIPKCLIWGSGKVFNKNIITIKYHEVLNKLKISAITSKSGVYDKILGIKFIKKEDINSKNYDYVIVMADAPLFQKIANEAQNMGFRENQIISYRPFNFEYFDFNKYKKIIDTPLTIFSNNCWGTFSLNSLGLKFNTPTINCFMSDDDYLKFLKNPKHYVEAELVFDKFLKMRSGIPYPALRCDDITIHFNHAKTFEEAKLEWDKRKIRINWNNIFVEMFTNDKNTAQEFIKLPYEKKICFVPFKPAHKQMIQIDFLKDIENMNKLFWQIIIDLSERLYDYYNVFDLLAENKLTKVVKLNKQNTPY